MVGFNSEFNILAEFYLHKEWGFRGNTDMITRLSTFLIGIIKIVVGIILVVWSLRRITTLILRSAKDPYEWEEENRRSLRTPSEES